MQRENEVGEDQGSSCDPQQYVRSLTCISYCILVLILMMESISVKELKVRYM